MFNVDSIGQIDAPFATIKKYTNGTMEEEMKEIHALSFTTLTKWVFILFYFFLYIRMTKKGHLNWYFEYLIISSLKSKDLKSSLLINLQYWSKVWSFHQNKLILKFGQFE